MDIYMDPRNSDHVENVRDFLAIKKRFEWMEFYQPQPEKAPWHVQVRIDCATGEPIWLNFWPHKGKAQRHGCSVVIGYDATRAMISQAIEDSADEAEVFEEYQALQAQEHA
jgi:hypothetical protein